MFIKFPSIENHYQKKTVEQFLLEFPELRVTRFILKEKLHGTNIQLIFEPGKPMEVGSRNQVLPEDGQKFFGIHHYLKTDNQMGYLIKLVQNHVDDNDILINLYGEFIGPGINKGVEYGDEKQILFFDMRIDKKMLSQKELEVFFMDRLMPHLLAPTVALVDGLRQSIDYGASFPSRVDVTAPIDNIMEGVVIKPYSKFYQNAGGHIVYLKHKTEEFKEKWKRKKRVKDPKDPMPDHVLDLSAEFHSHLTEARLQGVFSKYGPIEENKQLGSYIKYMLDDAREDFLKDNEKAMEKLDKKETKCVYNHSKVIVKMLQESL